MDTFLLQVNGTAGYPNIRDNRQYQNPSWATKGRDRDHGEVKPGDMLLVYCTGNAIDNGRCLAFSVDVRDVSEDHVTFHLAKDRLVEGVVLTPSYDERLRYAVKVFPGVRVLRYETRFEVFPEN